MSFDILREWDLESFDPGLEFFPETERATSLEVVEPPAVAAAAVTANIEVPKTDEMAREAASSANQNFASDMVVNQGNHDFDLDFDVTEDMMAMWGAESAARAQEDRDDLERERAGIGRKHERFGVERTDGAGGRVSNARQAADMIADMQQMQANTYNFSGSATSNGFNFNFGGEDFEMSDEQAGEAFRRFIEFQEEQIRLARESGEDPEAIAEMERQVREDRELLERITSGEATPEDREQFLERARESGELRDQIQIVAQQSANAGLNAYNEYVAILESDASPEIKAATREQIIQDLDVDALKWFEELESGDAELTPQEHYTDSRAASDFDNFFPGNNETPASTTNVFAHDDSPFSNAPIVQTQFSLAVAGEIEVAEVAQTNGPITNLENENDTTSPAFNPFV
ncbi:MAG TPA: hypothetical protein EYG18_05520 [Micavibrio sp.]|nr:hypothetical protein [Micavibrio sp.]